MESLRISGTWWLTEDPSDTLTGTLAFDTLEGASLQLIGHFGDRRSALTSLAGELSAPSMIHGVAEGNRVTLLRVKRPATSISMPGTVMQTYRADLVLLGELCPSPNEIKFTNLALRYTHLHEWGELSGLRLTMGDGFIQTTYQRPEEVTWAIPGGTLRLSVEGSWHQDNQNEYAIRESTQIVLDLNQGLSFEDAWRRFIHPIRNFLTLATAHPNAPTRVVGTIAGMNSDGSPWHQVDVLFALHTWPVGDTTLSVDEMIFGRRQAGNLLPFVLEKWFQLSEELEPVCDLLFGTKYNPQMDTSHRFLNLVQGLEAYHRRRFRNVVLPAEAHRQRIEHMLSKVDVEDRSWLQNALQWSNEPSLAMRLEELLNHTGQSLSSLLTDHKAFIRQVRDTRNYLTHFDGRLKNKAVKGIDLFYLGSAVQFLLIACLLVEIGFTTDEVRRLLSENYEFVRLYHALRRK